MRVSHDEGKRPNPISSETQVAESVENSAIILITNVENDESVTPYNEVQFQKPSAKVRLLTEQTYHVRVGIVLTMSTASNNLFDRHHDGSEFY